MVQEKIESSVEFGERDYESEDWVTKMNGLECTVEIVHTLSETKYWGGLHVCVCVCVSVGVHVHVCTASAFVYMYVVAYIFLQYL